MACCLVKHGKNCLDKCQSVTLTSLSLTWFYWNSNRSWTEVVFKLTKSDEKSSLTRRLHLIQGLSAYQKILTPDVFKGFHSPSYNLLPTKYSKFTMTNKITEVDDDDCNPKSNLPMRTKLIRAYLHKHTQNNDRLR